MPEVGVQMGLFGHLSLDVLPSLKAEMGKALRSCGLSREQVVDEINHLAEQSGISLSLTINTLEKWLAPSATRHVIPLRVLPLFCRVTGSTRPVEILAAALGLVVVGPREQALIHLGEAAVEAKRASAKRRRALEALEEMA